MVLIMLLILLILSIVFLIVGSRGPLNFPPEWFLSPPVIATHLIRLNKRRINSSCYIMLVLFATWVPTIDGLEGCNFGYPDLGGGPAWTIPVIGNSFLVKKLSKFHGGFHKALIHIASQYKTEIVGLKLGSELFVVVFSKELIKQVFIQDEFQGRPDSYFIRLRTMGSRKGSCKLANSILLGLSLLATTTAGWHYLYLVLS